ncbi:MAG: hypothetical protein AAB225_19635 [Acidobacteriota bacterium]
MTIRVMEELDFAPAAQTIAAEANAAVDEKQDNQAEQSNLHAMGGVVDGSDPFVGGPEFHVQTEEECHEQVERLLQDARRTIVANIVRGNNRAALRRLGEALHTVQDRVFHEFHPWPYRGILDAFQSDPAYMTCHALRDLSLFSRLDLGDLHQGRFDAEITGRLGRQWFLSHRFFHNPATHFPLPLGRDSGSADSFLGSGWMVTLTFGAAPGSLPAPGGLREPSSRSSGQSPDWQFVTRGPADMARAEDASQDFIQELRREVVRAPNGFRLWENFRLLSEPAVRSQRAA